MGSRSAPADRADGDRRTRGAGRRCGRAAYEKAGYGRLQLPKHSIYEPWIGLDGHEPVNLVHGETTPLAPGMCFSDEPGIYIPGSFGVRLEDCIYMTAAGPRWFSVPPSSIDAPFA